MLVSPLPYSRAEAPSGLPLTGSSYVVVDHGQLYRSDGDPESPHRGFVVIAVKARVDIDAQAVTSYGCGYAALDRLAQWG